MRFTGQGIAALAMVVTIGLALPMGIALSKVTTHDMPTTFGLSGYQGGTSDGRHRPRPSLGRVWRLRHVPRIGAGRIPKGPFCNRRASPVTVLEHDFAEASRLHRPLDAHRSVEP